MKRLILTFLPVITGFSCFAHEPVLAPQPTSCISTNFTATGNQHWQTIAIKISNNCEQIVDFDHSTITFLNTSGLVTHFWGDFSPLSYPVNELQMGQVQNGGQYLATMALEFSKAAGTISKLPVGRSFTLFYGSSTVDYVANSAKVYLNTSIATGNLDLINATAKPDGLAQAYAQVTLTSNGKPAGSFNLPWSAHQLVSGLAAGSYNVVPVNISDSKGNVYQGSANPAVLTVKSGTTLSSTIRYTLVTLNGIINIQAQSLPPQLAGYKAIPLLTLTLANSSNSTVKALPWGAVTAVSQLTHGATYRLTTPTITFNGFQCQPSLTPEAVIASANTPPTVRLSYSCSQIAMNNVTVNITGAPSSTAAVKVIFTPIGSVLPISKTIPLDKGTGTDMLQVPEHGIYTVSADTINGYTVSYSPQPLTASPGVTETIRYSQNLPGTGGRMMAYLAGWKTPPPAEAIANAGYTHVLLAFGVFSLSTPGQITSAFDAVTANYIQSLQAAGIKVLLSLGGASTGIPDTTVNFHQVVSLASSPGAFSQTFVASLENLIRQYGFDGFDFDIESGLNAGGSFVTPEGDIATLAGIINTLHAKYPNLLLSLAPQIANVAATSGFDAIWGNYASLIMQTHQSLSWVGIQVYNAGCAYGIDLICYDPNDTKSPNTAVAFATNLLENWPAQTHSGQITGFQPYISYLTPSQVVLGYPAPNAAGLSDGLPAAVTANIKRAIECLRTGIVSSGSCDSFVPPKAYPGFGGVFEWELSYDANNHYKFAQDLKNCVVNGNCA